MPDRNRPEISEHPKDSEQKLRRRAETRLQENSGTNRIQDSKTESRLHDMEVRQAELKLQNEKLQRSREETDDLLRRYFDLYEFAPVGYLIVDSDDKVVQVNLHTVEMLKRPKSHLVGRHLDFLIHPRDLPVFHKLRKQALETGASHSTELRMVGSGMQFDAQLHVRFLNDTEPPLLQIAAIDITDRREAERSVQEATQLLETRVQERTAELQSSRRELQYIAENTIHLLERERRKISLELHDTIAQGLATIKLLLENKLAMMGPEPPADQGSAFSIEHILDIAGRNLNETRRIMNYLRPKLLDEVGFLATLRWHWQEFERIHPEIVLHKEIRISESDLPEELTLVVYRIVQEASNNIGRHSNASRVDFSLRQKKSRLYLRIADNGSGFDAKHALEGRNNGMGITSMRERSELSGGEFSLRSNDGEGTVIEVRWKLDRWSRPALQYKGNG